MSGWKDPFLLLRPSIIIIIIINTRKDKGIQREKHKHFHFIHFYIFSQHNIYFFLFFLSLFFSFYSFISVAAQVISFLWGFLLPSVGVSLYFYSSPDSINDQTTSSPAIANATELKGHINHGAQFDSDNHIVIGDKQNPLQLTTLTKDVKDIDVEVASSQQQQQIEAQPRTFSWTRASQLLWKHFITSYSDKDVVQWSFWWALALCGALQVLYITFCFP